MFGCCNNLFSNCCRCNRCNRCNSCSCGGSPTPLPIHVFPPMPPTPTPTPPAPQLRGLEATFTAGAGATVADGFPIPFNNLVSNNVLGASFVTGAVILNRPGTYLVNWWVAPEIAQPAVEKERKAAVAQVYDEVSFAVTLNGQTVSGACAPSGTGQLSGSTFVTVTNTPSTLQVVNASGDNVFLAEVSTQAGLSITQFS